MAWSIRIPWCTSLVASLVLISLAPACQEEPPAPLGPSADFSWTPNCNFTPDIGLTGDVSEAGDAAIVDYFWEFGHDQASASGMAVEHEFPADGSYEVSLTVVDEAGLADTTTQTLDLSSCLALRSSSIVVNGDLAHGSADIENISGYDDAIPSFRMDLLDAEGLVRFADVDSGQHLIELGATVTVNSAEVECGAECGELADLTLEVIWKGWVVD
jgi:PKD repeat protein